MSYDLFALVPKEIKYGYQILIYVYVKLISGLSQMNDFWAVDL